MMIRYLLAILFFIFVSFLFFYCYSRFYNDDFISCDASASFLWGGDKLDLTIYQRLHNGYGFVSLSGVLNSGDGIKKYINKSVSFSYNKVDYIYTLKSNSINDSPQMTMSKVEEEKWIGDFFIKDGGGMLLKIIPYNNRSWVFYSGINPLFICNSNK
ncbi:hypothetical protein [Rosenbergiella epipactidis]|uniref:hypothetical protein n=1 Tax=Rosenbergiella epipactidis TaxID=1544694 RepID=UPI001F4FB81F|nr:hypothetical protein [Rosenbergiella epipactidis]